MASLQRRYILVALAVGGLLFGGGAYAGYRLHAWRTALATHMVLRPVAILAHAAQTEPAWIVAGDSRVELANLRTVCGEPALNAGISGARLQTMVDMLPEITAAVPAAKLTIAIGVNDAIIGRQTTITDFSKRYEHLLETQWPVAIATIAPVAAGMHYGSDYYSIDAIAAMNAVIRALAQKTGKRLIDLSSMAGPDGFLLPSFTADGVHFSPSGYQEWHRIIERSVCAAQH